MSKNETDVADTVLGLIFIPAAIVWKGYVLSVLWGWLLVPVFAFPALRLAPAMGVSLIIAYLTHQVDFDKKHTRPGWETLVLGMIIGLVSLGFGWIFKQFI